MSARQKVVGWSAREDGPVRNHLLRPGVPGLAGRYRMGPGSSPISLRRLPPRRLVAPGVEVPSRRHPAAPENRPRVHAGLPGRRRRFVRKARRGGVLASAQPALRVLAQPRAASNGLVQRTVQRPTVRESAARQLQPPLPGRRARVPPCADGRVRGGSPPLASAAARCFVAAGVLDRAAQLALPAGLQAPVRGLHGDRQDGQAACQGSAVRTAHAASARRSKC